MSEFKAGDRVRSKSSGLEGVVRKASRTDGGILSVLAHGTLYAYLPEHLEHVEEPLAVWEKGLLAGPAPFPARNLGFEVALDSALAEVREVMIDRHKKYGPGNILRHGEMGVVVRLGDKYERLDNSRGVDFADESVDDTALDIIGYGLIFTMLRKGSWPGQKPTAS